MNALWMLSALCLLPLSASLSPKAAHRYSSDGDGFHLREESFQAQESFVYTAKAHFVSGQACGLVFGAQENGDCFVFNVDRYENRTKLLSFTANENGGMSAKELYTERFIGNETTSEGEFALISPRLRENQDFYFKVVLTAEQDKVYGEFFIDNIKRFGVDSKIDLTAFETPYSGGKLGYNTFASEVEFSEETIGKSAYSYYSEPYRNQYHYSQFAHWNNDPNGLVYYNGYYHLYYQTNPYAKYWGDMYWGHARSKDLLHWQELPIAMFPDNGTLGFGEGNGYAWSGSAFIYEKGMSKAIDEQNWFPNGNGNGLLFAYTRDGGFAQDQVIASSDDGGMTFTKRVFVPQHLYKGGAKVDLRDPKMFVLPGNQGFGMVVSSQAENRVVFLQSNDLLSWRNVGGFFFPRPECVDVLDVTADDGTKHVVLTFMGREYVVGDWRYDGNTLRFIDQNGIDLSSLDMVRGGKMDYARDRYATQSFVIADPSSPYFGKPISVSWWSGVPGDPECIESGSLASFRSPWNGGGQTIPVEEGLRLENGEYVLVETPITYQNAALEKQTIFQGDLALGGTENPLSSVATSSLEVNADFALNGANRVEFRLAESQEEWIGVGYSKEQGYYVDRRNAPEASKGLRAYERCYETGPLEGAEEISFRILLDHGGIEVFADDGRYPFYVLHVSSPTSFGASLRSDGPASGHLEAFAISSTYEPPAEGEGMLYLSELSSTLDMNLAKKTIIRAYDSASSPISFALKEGQEVVSASKVPEGIVLEAKGVGEALLEVSTPSMRKEVAIRVHGKSTVSSDLTFVPEGIRAGQWNEMETGIRGKSATGDGFLMSQQRGADFVFSSSFSLQGAAAGLVFRADESMNDYVVANFDGQARITKLFSKRNGVIAEAPLGDIPLDRARLVVEAEGNAVKVFVNEALKIEAILPANELKEGYFGFNVFQGEALFQETKLMQNRYVYEGGELAVDLPFPGPVLRLVNLTNKNAEISPGLYETRDGALLLEEEIFLSLRREASYRFKAEGPNGATTFLVDVSNYVPTLRLESLKLREGAAYRARLYGNEVSSLTVNGVDAAYRIEEDILVVSPENFRVGSNEIVLNGTIRATVDVVASAGQGNDAFLRGALLSSLPKDPSSAGLYAMLGVSLLIALPLTRNLLKRKD